MGSAEPDEPFAGSSFTPSCSIRLAQGHRHSWRAGLLRRSWLGSGETAITSVKRLASRLRSLISVFDTRDIYLRCQAA